RRSARAHRQGMSRTGTVPATRQRSAVYASPHGARNTEARYTRKPSPQRRRSMGPAKPENAPTLGRCIVSLSRFAVRWFGPECFANSEQRTAHSDMRTLLVSLLPITILAIPQPAAAWGFEAHKYILDRAIALLPPEIRPFFEKYRTSIVEHAIDPDLWRTAGWADESP